MNDKHTVPDLERARADLNNACALYCRWYDTGNPDMNAASMAYALVTAIRIALRHMEQKDHTP